MTSNSRFLQNGSHSRLTGSSPIPDMPVVTTNARIEKLNVNAGVKMHRFAGAENTSVMLARRPRTGGLFFRHQAWVGLSAGVSELARRERRLL